MRERGFTLIDLLFSMAIIALLLSIIISTLLIAKKKAEDSFVKSSLISIRTLAQLYYTTQDFGSNATCSFSGSGIGVDSGVFTNSQIAYIISDIRKKLNPPATVRCSTNASGTKWAISAEVLRHINQSWCVDFDNTNTIGLISTGGSCN
jgi:prepilin-type N-terminal cleavage/methylation domain-containing protein